MTGVAGARAQRGLYFLDRIGREIIIAAYICGLQLIFNKYEIL
jgi:hypothetical protein